MFIIIIIEGLAARVKKKKDISNNSNVAFIY